MMYAVFSYFNLQSTYVEDIANGSAVGVEGFGSRDSEDRGRDDRGRGDKGGWGRGGGDRDRYKDSDRDRDSEDRGRDDRGRDDRGRSSAIPEVAATMDTLVNQMEDALAIKKYRKDYEKAIRKMDDMFDLLRIRSLTTLENVKTDDDAEIAKVANELDVYQNAKISLEGALSFIDSK